jgi:hypothetical protein
VALAPPPHSRLSAWSPRFGATGQSWFDLPASWVVRHLYDRGPAVRYAVEQTGAFTVPRTLQQLRRSRGVTGENNVAAAKETLFRDLAADFTDTFMPGLLATLAMGPVIDRANQSLVRFNIPEDALHWYEQATQRGSKQGFYQAIAEQLHAHAAEPGVSNTLDLEPLVQRFEPLSFQQKLERTRQHLMVGLKRRKSPPKAHPGLGVQFEDAARQVAEQLGKSHLDISIPVTLPNGTPRKIHMTLVELMRDLHVLNTAQQGVNPAQWTKTLGQRLAKTRPLKHWQMIGNVLALVSSLSIPFAIRLITRAQYGHDAFPGTKAIRDHIEAKTQGPLKSGASHTTASESTDDKPRFRLFPYLSDTLKKGNLLPTVLTLGFFGLLGTMVGRRFKAASLNMNKLENWFQVYAFQRGFPFTTVPQMELTYGLLCGIRLASSREGPEWREAAIRDCLLGWPLLTYGFDWMSKIFAKQWFDPGLRKALGTTHHVLYKSGVDGVRAGEEISANLLKHIPMKLPVDQALPIIKRFKDRGTFTIAALSWFLMAVAEPQLSIRLTNALETKKLTPPGLAPTLPTPTNLLDVPRHTPAIPKAPPTRSAWLPTVNEPSAFGAAALSGQPALGLSAMPLHLQAHSAFKRFVLPENAGATAGASA